MTVADVGKVLMSVSKACESGYRVVFDEEGSYMEEKRTGAKTRIHKKNGVYVMTLRMDEPECGKGSRQDFRRQGCATSGRRHP